MSRLGSVNSSGWWRGSISRRVGLAAVVALLLTAAVAVISLRGISTLSAQLNQAVAAQNVSNELTAALLRQSQDLMEKTRAAVAAESEQDRATALAALEDAKRVLGETVDRTSQQLSDQPQLQATLQDGF